MTKTKSAGRKRSAPALDTEINRAPALRISHIVSGRINENGRVRYFVDPKGTDGERAIPEDVVLKRWRRREMTGHTFHGCRLGPNTWRAIDKAFGNEAQMICQLTVDEISAARKSLHMVGKAADIRIASLSEEVLGGLIRSFRQGGVGYYYRAGPKGGWIHADTGLNRTWKG